MFINIVYNVVTVLFLIVCLFMILLVLIQKGRGGGLASAFGGMGGNTAFGSKTGDVLTWATSIVFGIFLVLAVILNLVATSVHQVELQSSGATEQRVEEQGGEPSPPPAQPQPSTQS